MKSEPLKSKHGILTIDNCQFLSVCFSYFFQKYFFATRAMFQKNVG